MDIEKAVMGKEFTMSQLVKGYRLFVKMMEYPDIVFLFRENFLKALEKKGITNSGEIRKQALEILKASGIDEPDENLISEYTGILTDVWFAASFSNEEIENNINLARKQKHFAKLSIVLNKEGATFRSIKQELDNFCCIPEGDLHISPNEAEGVRVGLINRFISNQLPFIGIAKHHVTIRDIGDLSQRIIRTKRRPGRIGGKSAGMLLAYRILVPRLQERDPELDKYIRIPESWYINTGIFSDFIDANELFHFHAQKYKTRDDIEEDYKNISEYFKNASFPRDVSEQFKNLLKEAGESPLVLRSSSLLEDNFGLAFSGKYDSVFLANQGDLEKRLKEFEWGLKRVHMSTYGPSPILYRKNHDLLDFDEKMSILVQKVVGRRFGRYFFPFAAGVGFSYSSYSWTPRIKKEDGVIRLVMGLGTRAVDRVGEDYPRMVHLSDPSLRPEATSDKIRKYSQKFMDVLNLETGDVESKHYMDLMKEIDHPDLFHALSEDQAGHLRAPMFKQDRVDLNNSCVTFENLLLKTPLTDIMRKMLRKLEDAYDRPVDVEFAFDSNTLYLLQCRSLSIARDMEVSMPDKIPEGDLLFKNTKVISGGAVKDIEFFVYVDPKAYAAISNYNDKLEIAKVVSRINTKMESKRYALFGPGRWGSNDINLGVKAAYEDINNTLVLGEVAFEEQGSTPEVSYGTHFFNDLVESGIVHVAVFPDEESCFFNEEFVLTAENQLTSFLPEYKKWESVVHIIRMPDYYQGRRLNVFQDSKRQTGAGFIGNIPEKNQQS